MSENGESLVITYSEPLTGSVVEAGDYGLTGLGSVTITSATLGTGANANKITLALSGVIQHDATLSNLVYTASAGATNSIKDISRNSAANQTLVSITNNSTMDTIPPIAVATIDSLSSDTGTPGDFITETTSEQIISGTYKGTIGIGETLKVSLNNGGTWVAATTVTVQSIFGFGVLMRSGEWTLTGATLTTNTLKVAVFDTAGNMGAVATKAVQIADTTPPTIGAFSMTDATHLSVTSNEAVTAYLYPTGTIITPISTTALTANQAASITIAAQNAVGTFDLVVKDASDNATTSTKKVILGTTGNDNLSGTTGVDFISGLGGVDTITDFDVAKDSLFINAAATAIVQITANTDFTSASIAASDSSGIGKFAISAATATAGVNIIGSALSDSITGSSSNDTITGGIGADTIDGGTGTDQYVISATGQTGAVPANWSASSTIDTTNMDIYTIGVGDTLDLSAIAPTLTTITATTTAVSASAAFTAAGTGTAAQSFKGTYADNTFTSSASGTDTLLVYDNNGSTDAGALEGVVLKGSVVQTIAAGVVTGSASSAIVGWNADTHTLSVVNDDSVAAANAYLASGDVTLKIDFDSNDYTGADFSLGDFGEGAAILIMKSSGRRNRYFKTFEHKFEHLSPIVKANISS